MTNLPSTLGDMKPVKSKGVSRTKCPQRFEGAWPTRSKLPKYSKIRTYNLRDEMNLPATTNESE